jgi:hypothetical protein
VQSRRESSKRGNSTWKEGAQTRKAQTQELLSQQHSPGECKTEGEVTKTFCISLSTSSVSQPFHEALRDSFHGNLRNKKPGCFLDQHNLRTHAALCKLTYSPYIITGACPCHSYFTSSTCCTLTVKNTPSTFAAAQSTTLTSNSASGNMTTSTTLAELSCGAGRSTCSGVYFNTGGYTCYLAMLLIAPGLQR